MGSPALTLITFAFEVKVCGHQSGCVFFVDNEWLVSADIGENAKYVLMFFSGIFIINTFLNLNMSCS